MADKCTSPEMKEVLKWAYQAPYDDKKGWENLVHIMCEDGSSFVVRAAYIHNYNDSWIVVMAEHYQPMVFAKDDLLLYWESKIIHRMDK